MKKSSCFVLVPFVIGAALLSGCAVDGTSPEGSEPEAVGATAEADSVYSASQSLSALISGGQPAGWPGEITDSVGISGNFSSNGANVTATAILTFSNGDPPLALPLQSSSRSSSYVSLSGTSTFTGSGNGLVITAQLSVYDAGALLGTYTTSAYANPPPVPPPVIYPGGVSEAIPGQYIEIYGTNLSTQTVACGGTTACGGVSVILAGEYCAVTYASAGQVNAIVPASLAAGNYQLIIEDNGALSTPAPVTVY
jgi:hypothetical protein